MSSSHTDRRDILVDNAVDVSCMGVQTPAVLQVLSMSWLMPSGNASCHRQCFMSPRAAAMPGPAKDKQRHSWQRKSVLVLMGSLEVRQKCQESAWHVMSQDSRVEGTCIRTPGRRRVQDGSKQLLSSSY